MGKQQPLSASVVYTTPQGGGCVLVVVGVPGVCVGAGTFLCVFLYLAPQKIEGAVAAVASISPAPRTRFEHWR
jgi:hypothetical protein